MGQGQQGGQHDPYTNFRFGVSISGGANVEGCFSKVTGLEAEMDMEEWRCGTDPPTPRKIPLIVKYGAVTLEHGMTQDTGMAEWFSKSINGTDPSYRASVTITLKGRGGGDLRTWKYADAFCKKYAVGDLDANSAAVLIESAEIEGEAWTGGGLSGP